MDQLVYPRERTLGALTLILGILTWILLIVGTLGIVLFYILLAFIGYIFAQSGLIAWIKGTGVKLSPEQHPDLFERVKTCCQKLNMAVPDVYILEGGGMLNAFATRFFGRNFVVLLSDVVDALEDEPDGINFYLGHELGHIRMQHLTGRLWRLPVLWLPLVGAAYSRARERTCDLHGRACCDDAQNAARALVVLAAGARRWKTTHLANYARQSQENSGFLASFHELVGGYPWLTNRVAHMLDPAAPLPGRNPLAYLLAFFVPYGGRVAGGLGGTIILIGVIGVLAATIVPAYQNYKARTAAHTAWQLGEPIREGLAEYYKGEEEVPDSFEAAGLPSRLEDGTSIELDTNSMTVLAYTPSGILLMEPQVMEDGSLKWFCLPGEEREKRKLRQENMPRECRLSEDD
ncbi:MAG: M48 family metalloprotease [Zoogloeaceae bacterium]|jgi:Zn-dependent protease with chaperone function|nr:M48 family metalloprotease [Zoogloeaceae bacterium]